MPRPGSLLSNPGAHWSAWAGGDFLVGGFRLEFANWPALAKWRSCLGRRRNPIPGNQLLLLPRFATRPGQRGEPASPVPRAPGAQVASNGSAATVRLLTPPAPSGGATRL